MSRQSIMLKVKTDKLLTALTENKLNYKAAAEKAGVSAGTISSLVKGKYVNLVCIGKVAEALELNVAELIEKE